ncbi:hypothetical protein [Paragemmobacter ruber]|nr:hypothetical protein [Rhodobacter ruber]
MQPTGSDTSHFTLLLAAPSAVAHLAAPILADHLGITTGAALQRLTESPGPIARRLAPQPAQLLYSLLSALGLNLLLQRDDDRSPLFDLSIQPSIWVDPGRLSRRLARVLGLAAETIEVAIARPGGLMLTALPLAEAHALERRLAAIRGLIVLRFEREGAFYDLFPTRVLLSPERDALALALQAEDARPDPLTGACAAGLNEAACTRVLAAVPAAGLLALDRSIQRFDLHLVGVHGWVTGDLADFLATRTSLPRARFEVISQDDPITLDRGLTHAVLRQFCADYAAIGLQTRPCLRGLTRFPDNPTL